MTSRDAATLLRIAYIGPDPLGTPGTERQRAAALALMQALAGMAELLPVLLGHRRDWPGLGLSGPQGLDTPVFLPPRLARWDHAADGQPLLHPPGLGEARALPTLPRTVLDSLSDPAALLRPVMNPRRLERLLARLLRWRPTLVVLDGAALAPLAPALRGLGCRLAWHVPTRESLRHEELALLAPDAARQAWHGAAARAFARAERLAAPLVDQLWVASPEAAGRFAGLVPADRLRLLPPVAPPLAGAPLALAPPGGEATLFCAGRPGEPADDEAARRLAALSLGLGERGLPHRLLPMAPAPPDWGAVTLALQPLALGHGPRLESLEALAAGCPLLATPRALEGLAIEPDRQAVVLRDLATLPDMVAALLADPARRARLGAAGQALAARAHGPDALRTALAEALPALGLRATPRLPRPPTPLPEREALRFNPLTRLLDWSFFLRDAAGAAARLVAADGRDLANAVVLLHPGRHGVARVEAVAVLPADLPPEGVALDITTPGLPTLRHPPPARRVEERAGMVALSPRQGRFELLAWGLDGPPPLHPAPVETLPAATLPPGAGGLWRMRVDLPPTAPVLALRPAQGEGQALHRPALWTRPRPPSSARLHAMAGRHQGETAWLIGNGPSVRIQDLDALAGRLTFGFNRFHLAHARTRLRPTYTVSGDRQMIEDFGAEIVAASGGTVFLADQTPPALEGDYIWVRQWPVFPPLFSFRPDRVVSPGGSSLYVALQLAYWMGVRRVFLYGTDFSFRFTPSGQADPFRIATGEGNHFIPGYRAGRPWCPPALRDITAAFLAARRVMEAAGGFIRNASHGGALEIFDRQPFEAALAVL